MAAYEFCSSICVRIVSVSKYIINHCIKINIWSIAWFCIHSFAEAAVQKISVQVAFLKIFIYSCFHVNFQNRFLNWLQDPGSNFKKLTLASMSLLKFLLKPLFWSAFSIFSFTFSLLETYSLKHCKKSATW